MSVPRVTLADLQQSIPVVDTEGRPSPVFLRFINGSIRALKNGVNAVIDAQNAAAAATAAASAATSAAASATAAAAAAGTATDDSAREQALVNSYIEPGSVLSASPLTITVSAHTRRYADGTSAAVSGGSVSATGAGDVNYVSYNDPMRTGGVVIYEVSTTQPIQTGDTHVIGAVMVPASGTTPGGSGPRPPGYVIP